MRVRGLKQSLNLLQPLCVLVAPRAGAWIETNSLTCVEINFIVAPRAGAWIETNG